MRSSGVVYIVYVYSVNMVVCGLGCNPNVHFHFVNVSCDDKF